MATGEHLDPPTLAARVEIAKRHLAFSIEWKGEKVGIFEMRRHYTNYFKNIPNFKSFRTRLVETESPIEAFGILDEISENFTEVLFV